MPLPLVLSVLRDLLLLQLVLKLIGYYFHGLLAAGDAAHLSKPEDTLAHCYIQVSARLQYAINGKRNLNAYTSLRLQHALSYD